MKQNSSEIFIYDFWLYFKQASFQWHYLISFLHLLVGVISFGGNIMVIIYYIRRKRLNRTSSYLIFNLAIVNSIVISITSPMAASSGFNERWIFGQIGCNVYGLLSSISSLIGILSITAISIERYLVVRYPFLKLKIHKRTILGKIFLGIINLLNLIESSLIKVVIAIIWIISVLVVFSQLLVKHQFVLEGFLTTCTYDYMSQDQYMKKINFLLTLSAFVVPLIIMTISYSLLYILLKYRRQTFEKGLAKNKRIISPICLFNSKSFIDVLKSFQFDYNSNRKNIRSSMKYSIDAFVKAEVQVAKKGALMIAIFCIGWAPYTFVKLFAQSSFYSIANPYLVTISSMISKALTFFNPILYSIIFSKKSSKKNNLNKIT